MRELSFVQSTYMIHLGNRTYKSSCSLVVVVVVVVVCLLMLLMLLFVDIVVY